MTPNLTDDLRRAVEERNGAPLTIIDPATNASYVLMRAEDFEKFKAVNEDVESLYPLLADLDPEDWEDASHYDRTS